jgi:hypothetical protein
VDLARARDFLSCGGGGGSGAELRIPASDLARWGPALGTLSPPHAEGLSLLLPLAPLVLPRSLSPVVAKLRMSDSDLARCDAALGTLSPPPAEDLSLSLFVALALPLSLSPVTGKLSYHSRRPLSVRNLYASLI